jgi:DNA-binding LacI/PurR family transcriptional regulator
MPTKPATRAQVAQLAKVSESTVSYVLNGQRPISEETKARVMAAIEKLQYVPHYGAGLLAGKKSKTVAMLLPGRGGAITPSSVEYLNGANQVCTEQNYHLVIWSSETVAMEEVIQFYRSGLISGIILMEIKMIDPRIEVLKKNRIPFVMIGRTSDYSEYEYVDRDFKTAAKSALEYLVSLKHKNITLIGNLRKMDSKILGADHRFHTEITKLCKAYSITLNEIYYYNEPQTGEKALKEIISHFPETTAVICLNEQTAVGLVNSSHHYNLSIPKDLSILSINTPNNQVESTYPALTTVSPPSQEMGQEAMKALLSLIEGKKIKTTRLWSGELEIRESTSLPRSQPLLVN